MFRCRSAYSSVAAEAVQHGGSITVIECRRQMPDSPTTNFVELHEHHIESDRQTGAAPHHIRRHDCDPPLLCTVDPAGKALEAPTTRLDLHHHQGPTSRGHGEHVDLVPAAPDVAAENSEPTTREPSSGDAFAPAACGMSTTGFSRNHSRAMKRDSAMSTIFISISWRSS